MAMEAANSDMGISSSSPKSAPTHPLSHPSPLSLSLSLPTLAGDPREGENGYNSFLQYRARIGSYLYGVMDAHRYTERESRQREREKER